MMNFAIVHSKILNYSEKKKKKKKKKKNKKINRNNEIVELTNQKKYLIF